MTPDVLDAELARLPDDLPYLARRLGAQLETSGFATAIEGVKEVVVVGSGDSLHAGLSSQLAFHSLGGVSARVLSVHAFPSYAAEWLAPDIGRRLVVVVSASGSTPGALAAAAEASSRGTTVLSLVGDPSSPLAGCGDLVLAHELPDRGRSPGVRTYQASLTGLLLLAARLGAVTGRSGSGAMAKLDRDLLQVGEALRCTGPGLQTAIGEAADLLGTGPMIFLGAGPQLGTAKHAAVKVVEASGVLAIGQELEEWWHVERMADPPDMTTFVIVTPRSAPRATRIATTAAARGRRVVLVAPVGGAPDVPGASVFPIAGSLSEELSPLTYQGFGVLVAASLARRLGRGAFEGGDAGRPSPPLR